MSTAHSYRVFGLGLRSEIALPGLPDGDGDADVEIRVGPVAEQLTEPIRRGVLFELSGSELLLSIAGVGRFLASAGRSVTVDPVPGASDADLRAFLLGSMLGAIAHQRGLLPLHGSAVQTADGCALFTGPSGAGKSTLVAALCARGHRFLSDDLSVVATDRAPVSLFPGIARLKLWHDTLLRLGSDPQRLDRLRPGLDKYDFPIAPAPLAEPHPITRLFGLAIGSAAEPVLTPLLGVDRLNLVRDSVYRPNYLAGPQATQRLFAVGSRLAQQARAFRLERPADPDALDRLADRVSVELSR